MNKLQSVSQLLKKGVFNYSKCFVSDSIANLMTADDISKLDYIANDKVEEVIEFAAGMLNPRSIMIFDDSKEDVGKVRLMSLEKGEESALNIPRHTIHFDGYINNKQHDQARDTKNTATLLPPGVAAQKNLNIMDRDEGLEEIFGIMEDCMEGKDMYVRFFALGPVGSEFANYALQITDSAYVAHSEDLLYRSAYEAFKDIGDDFFYHVHSAGELDQNGHTKNLDERRIFIDPTEYRVFSMNNQYAGNSLGLKKLSLRLAIWKCNQEHDWLAEHMFISAFPQNEEGTDKCYIAGAYPSACGKTSTAMIEGSTIVGDDIGYFRKGPNGELRGVNIELGIFGIIRDVSEKDDPLIYKPITQEGAEVIFSNVMINDGKPYWAGMGYEPPKEGYNHSGEWFEGKTDENGEVIPISHPNSRFTLKLEELENVDEALHDPEGVHIEAIFYGGRDSDTCVPLIETFDWDHGVFVGAAVESETTAAILGEVGIKKPSPFANYDFIVVPLGDYLRNHFQFGRTLSNPPKVYHCNYFLREGGTPDGAQLNPKTDTKIWLLYACARARGAPWATVHNTPIGLIPTYESLKHLFMEEQGKDYKEEDYIKQFSIRAKKYLEKFERTEELFKEEDMPEEFVQILESQKEGVMKLMEKYGEEERVSPYEFEIL